MPGGARYRFVYGVVAPHPPRLWEVVLESGPEQRRVVLEPQNGDDRVWAIRDPDGTQVQFGYSGDAPGPWSIQWSIQWRTDRRGTVTRYSYSTAGKLTQARTEMQGTGEDIITRMTPAETRGLQGAAVPLAEAYTLLDGPRDDVQDHTRFWLDRFGAPTQIRDALGHETLLTRGDPRFPALVTHVRYADGFEESATYDADDRLVLQEIPDYSSPRLHYDARGKVVRAEGAWDQFEELVYNGLGHLAFSRRSATVVPQEEYRTDALANVAWKRLTKQETNGTGWPDPTLEMTHHYQYTPGTGRLARIQARAPRVWG